VTGRVLAVVTGAASGIGRATAYRLAADGFVVCGLDVDGDGLDRTVAELQRRHGAGSGLVVDLTDRTALADVLGKVVADGPPAVLVNDAGIGVAADVVDTEPADWDRVLAVNLTAVFDTCRLVLPAMLAAGGGIIVNVASVAGTVGIARRAAYCASKAGVIGLTRSIAADFAGRGIRANAICPGTVASEWIEKILAGAPDPAATRAAMERRQLDGRMGTPEEVAAGIGFLCTPEARFVNGSVFVMDGGMTAV